MPESQRVGRNINWLAVATVVIIAAMFALIPAHFYLLDGLDGWLFSQGLTEDTVYADGYSDSAFRRVRIGMTVDTVLKLLGEPLRVRTDDYALRSRAGESSDECWAYTKTPGDTHDRQRLICFSNGIVSTKESSYWVD